MDDNVSSIGDASSRIVRRFGVVEGGKGKPREMPISRITRSMFEASLVEETRNYELRRASALIANAAKIIKAHDGNHLLFVEYLKDELGVSK